MIITIDTLISAHACAEGIEAFKRVYHRRKFCWEGGREQSCALMRSELNLTNADLTNADLTNEY